MVRAGMSVGMLLLSAGLCLGQNALGDGRALDRNARVGGTGVNNPTRDYTAEMRFRNALVTGNVPGGAGFRGITGYGLEYDFRQRVGSDDLFSFRRDSFTSGLAGTGIRGTEALQYQLALTVGNEPPRNLRGSLLTSRTGNRVTAGIPSYPTESIGGATDLRQATPAEMGEYEYGSALALRSMSAYAAQRSLNPSMLYMQEDEGGVAQGLVASPLRGLAREDLVGDAEARGARRDPAAGDRMSRDADEPEAQDGQRTRGTGRGATGEVRDRLSNNYMARVARGEDQPGRGEADPADPASPADPAQGAGDPFLEQLSALQQVLRDGTLMDAPSGAGAESTDGTEAGGAGSSDGAMAQRVPGWEDLIATLRQGVGTVEVPAPKLDRASAYDLHVDRGKAMMADGRYFEAEQRFTMALAARPGDPIAAIGRVHAQIGAGLDLSAAVNLRSFLVEHPEFVGARYEASMLPDEARLRSIIRRLTEQVRDESASRRVRESALLLAYVSFHAGDRASTALGLERLDEREAGQRDPLAPLLDAVWLDSGRSRPTDEGASGEGASSEEEDEGEGGGG